MFHVNQQLAHPNHAKAKPSQKTRKIISVRPNTCATTITTVQLATPLILFAIRAFFVTTPEPLISATKNVMILNSAHLMEIGQIVLMVAA